MDRRHATIALLTAGALTLAAACGGGGDGGNHGGAAGSAHPGPSDDATDGWKGQLAALCDSYIANTGAIPQPDTSSAASLAAYAAALRQAGNDSSQLTGIDVPADVRPTIEHVTALGDQATAALDRAGAVATAGDVAGANHAIDEWADYGTQMGTALALAGVKCGPYDPARLAGADLNVPLAGWPEQLAAGFGSIWVSENVSGQVDRVDPDDGKILATVDVGPGPLKLQPADGQMIVRTASAYLAIDPSTNAVTATLSKADVGPNANRSWAMDGALWICDGRRLHRYDPATLTSTAVLDLDVDCGQVYVTEGLVVAWSYNDDPGQSGTSAAAFVDPYGDRIAGAPTGAAAGQPRVVATTPYRWTSASPWSCPTRCSSRRTATRRPVSSSNGAPGRFPRCPTRAAPRGA
jgi:hypothetical protein